MPDDRFPNDETLVLRSRSVVTKKGVEAAGIVVRSGKIVDFIAYDSEQGEDLGRLALMPGLVDPHVHLNEPGRTEWEGMASGTASAAAGGITLLVDMPLNSSPVTTSAEALERKREAAENQLHVDVGFHGGLVPGNEEQIEGLIDSGVLGIKAFLCDSGLDEFPATTEKELRRVMPLLARRGVPLLVHAEIVSSIADMADPRRYADYLATRPARFERDAIAMLIRLCRETGCQTHVVHLAAAECLSMLREAREEKLPITVETCPHYLTFSAEEIPDGATQYKCAPPIRTAENRERLWQGLAEGAIDFIASDHSPCPPEMKHLEKGRFDLAWGGISSLQLGLPVMWTEARQRGYELTDVVKWMSINPATLTGHDSGIEIGNDANLVVFDPDETFVVSGDQLHHRHSVTPYEGRTLFGVVKRTYLRGNPAAIGDGRAL